jgi:uncharacterized membrane protein YeaQ/YmgE (transglycosylase-associated protein family)
LRRADMEIQALIIFLLVGLVAGWLASFVVAAAA